MDTISQWNAQQYTIQNTVRKNVGYVYNRLPHTVAYTKTTQFTTNHNTQPNQCAHLQLSDSVSSG